MTHTPDPALLRHLVPLGTLDAAIDYICYCRTGRQSAVAAFLLRQRGFRAHALRGGFTALPAGTGG